MTSLHSLLIGWRIIGRSFGAEFGSTVDASGEFADSALSAPTRTTPVSWEIRLCTARHHHPSCFESMMTFVAITHQLESVQILNKCIFQWILKNLLSLHKEWIINSFKIKLAILLHREIYWNFYCLIKYLN